MKITTTPQLKQGDRLTIVGLAFGAQYGPEGVTFQCKRGQETELVVSEVVPGESASFILPAKKDKPQRQKAQAPKRYGPPTRARW